MPWITHLTAELCEIEVRKSVHVGEDNGITLGKGACEIDSQPHCLHCPVPISLEGAAPLQNPQATRCPKGQG